MDISYCFTLIFACIQIIGAVQSGEQNIPNQILQDNKMVWYQSIYIHQNIRKLEGTSVRTSM